MAIIKLCHECGEPLDPYRGGNHKYCDTCRDKVNAKNQKHWVKEYRSSKANCCINCGKPIYSYKGGNHRYCKVCSAIIRLEKVRLLRLAYYNKWKDVLIHDLGSSNLTEHPKIGLSDDDFTHEFNTVRRELKRLRLKN